MIRYSLVCAFTTLVICARLYAVPPLVSGDVPTADKETFEVYAGMRYQSESDSVNRQLPFIELVYGLTERQEITFEIPYLSQQGEHGFGDAVLGTKYKFLKETETLPGISATFEVKLPSATTSHGLGSGTFDYDLRIPAQKTWGLFTLLGNVGYTIVGDQKSGGITETRKNVWFASLAPEFKVTDKINLLAEVYLETSGEPGRPNRFAADVAIEREIARNLTLQAAVGKSLREGSQGGPDLRVYVGLHWNFDSPWKFAAK